MDEIARYWTRTDRKGRRLAHCRDGLPVGEWKAIVAKHFRMATNQWPELLDGAGDWIDWGAGGGANAVAWAAVCRRVYCVDLSETALEACRQEVEAVGGAACLPAVLPASGIPDCPALESLECNGFVSTSTFQHFPSKEYTAQIVRLIPRLVRPGGYVFIQTRRDTPRDYAEYAGRPYEQRAFFATVYGVDEFRGLLEEHGVTVERVEEVAAYNQYTYYFGRVADKAVPKEAE